MVSLRDFVVVFFSATEKGLYFANKQKRGCPPSLGEGNDFLFLLPTGCPRFELSCGGLPELMSCLCPHCLPGPPIGPARERTPPETHPGFTASPPCRAAVRLGGVAAAGRVVRGPPAALPPPQRLPPSLPLPVSLGHAQVPLTLAPTAASN